MDPSNNSCSGNSSSSSNKIRQIVRLQQLLKKWKKLAAASPSSSTHRLIRNNSASHHHLESNVNPSTNNSSSSASASTKSINKFLKKTLSFSDKDRPSSADQGCNSNSGDAVPKGCLAVSVGKEEKEEVKRFVIPMDYLAHQSFQNLLREAEEEFGFQQQGVLKIPCQVSVFENILKMMQHNSNTKRQHAPQPPAAHDNVIHNVGCCSPENHQHHQGIMPPQLCS